MLCVAPGKPIGAQILAFLMGKCFDQQFVGLWQTRYLLLQGQPFGGMAGKVSPVIVFEITKYARAQLGGCGEFRSHEGGDFRSFICLP